MARQHTPQQQLNEAQQIARDHGMFVVDMGGDYLLYRRTAPRNTFIGKRAEAFFS